MASPAMIYLLSSPPTERGKSCNLAVTSSLIFRFSIPFNEAKGTYLGIETAIDLIKVVKIHLEVNPDASCLCHLLRPDISIKNQSLQLLPETTLRFEWAKGTANPADFTSKLFLTPASILNSGFYRHGLIDYMRSETYGHIFL